MKDLFKYLGQAIGMIMMGVCFTAALLFLVMVLNLF